MRVRAPAWLVTLAVLAGAGLCVRLGIWQLSRLHQKQAYNRAVAQALAGPTLPLGGAASDSGTAGHRALARGRYDEARSFVLRARVFDGRPGVELVTPLVLEDGTALLVDRGW